MLNKKMLYELFLFAELQEKKCFHSDTDATSVYSD